MIELLHPVTLGVAVACVPVATVAVSGAIDLIAHRQHQHHSAVASLELATTPAIPTKESNNSAEDESRTRG